MCLATLGALLTGRAKFGCLSVEGHPGWCLRTVARGGHNNLVPLWIRPQAEYLGELFFQKDKDKEGVRFHYGGTEFQCAGHA